MIDVRISGAITIDDVAAEMLDHITSYGFAEYFVEKCSRRFTKEQIRAALDKLHGEVRSIVHARNKAVNAIQAELKT